MEIKLKNYLINTLDNGNKIYLIPMLKSVYEEFVHDYTALHDQVSFNKFANKYGFEHKQVLLDGTTYINVHDKEEVESVRPILNRILPRPKMTTNAITEKREPAYKCFCCGLTNIESVLEHKTSIDSWNCLMIRIGEPEYAIVLEIKNS